MFGGLIESTWCSEDEMLHICQKNSNQTSWHIWSKAFSIISNGKSTTKCVVVD